MGLPLSICDVASCTPDMTPFKAKPATLGTGRIWIGGCRKLVYTPMAKTGVGPELGHGSVMSDSLAGPSGVRAARELQIEALVAHPAMPDAMRMMCGGLVQLFQGNRLLNLIASDRARLVMAFMATYLDA